MKDLRVLKPLLIYRAPDQTGLFRCCGLFCLGHTFMWSGITWLWLSGRSDIDVPRMSLDKWKKLLIKGDVKDQSSGTTNQPEVIQSIEVKVPKFFSSLESQFQSIRMSNAESAAKFIGTFRPLVDSVSTFVQQNRTNLLSCLSTLLALTTLIGGYMLPRRVVRQLSLLPLGSSVSSPYSTVTAKMQQLVEIKTYEAFGLKAQGVRLVVPVSSIRTNVDRKKKQYLSFNIQHHFFPFILQTEDAEFPEPEEFEYTFIPDDKH